MAIAEVRQIGDVILARYLPPGIQPRWLLIRFSFPGHGNSEGTQPGVTIAGEMLDLQAAVERVAKTCPVPLSILA
ncbi:MAG TPA: hypothetical protein VGP70_02015 [Actinomadura sp.]|jgi:hypothetical protein|nr:hypothetical protein [Actinomadura sp.]